MLQAQIIDADFYPVVVDTHPAARRRRTGRGSHAAAKRRSGTRTAVLLLCGVLAALLALRVALWANKRNEAELLTLVNPWNSMEYTGFVPKLVEFGDGLQVDERCAEDLRLLLDDCAAAGHQPLVCSAYRSRETQEQLYQDKVERLLAAGYDSREAPALAALEVARPGTSEHELGLAVDLVDAGHQALDQSQENTGTQRWLMENAWQYGFILRYPQGASGITGIVYEPWHYRYVGRTAAQQIHQLDLTLEEYLSMFYSEEAVVVAEKKALCQ